MRGIEHERFVRHHQQALAENLPPLPQKLVLQLEVESDVFEIVGPAC